MSARLIYLITVVLAGWGVTFLLRALPFLLFAGRNRRLPAWVERFGRVVSPIIIGGLIVYSYSGLEWRTFWPYAAGALTVGLQLAFRCPLVSIIVGTVLYMFLVAGCQSVSEPLEFDAAHPAIEILSDGRIKMLNRYTLPNEVPRILEEYSIPKDATIHILVDENFTDRRAVWVFQHNILGRAGYSRVIAVSKRRAKSSSGYAREQERQRRK